MSILVVCSHHDDETLGMGGTLALMAREHVSILTLGNGPNARRPQDGDMPRLPNRVLAHQSAALNTLGEFHGIHVLQEPYPDQQFDTVPLIDIVRDIELRTMHCHTIYTHHAGDLNRDHRIVHEAVLVATRPTPGQTVKRVYSFEVPSSTEWNFTGQPFTPNVFQSLTRDALDRKIKAMQCYETEIRESPHPRSPEVLEAKARVWGSVCGSEFAEAFMLVREIR